MYRGVASLQTPTEWNPQTISSGVLDDWNVLPQGIWNGGRSSSSSSQVSLSSSPSEREGRHRRRRVDQFGTPLEAMGECGVQGPFVSSSDARHSPAAPGSPGRWVGGGPQQLPSRWVLLRKQPPEAVTRRHSRNRSMHAISTCTSFDFLARPHSASLGTASCCVVVGTQRQLTQSAANAARTAAAIGQVSRQIR